VADFSSLIVISHVIAIAIGFGLIDVVTPSILDGSWRVIDVEVVTHILILVICVIFPNWYVDILIFVPLI
jgi:hypothetical protein